MKHSIIFTSLLTGLLFLFGCSANESDVVSPGNPELAPKCSSCLGYFRIVMNPQTQLLEIEPDMTRNAQINVTKLAKVTIDKLTWEPVSRNWTIEATVSNPSPFTGYGVWVVFSELGQKKLIGQDGFIWIPKGDTFIRVPFLALAKNQPLRAFPAFHSEKVTVVIHWPEGVNKWVPIEFFIDASWPAERETPMVEQLASGLINPDPIPQYFIRAWVADFQDDSSKLDVYADLTPIGGNNYSPMFDDGLHQDGGAGDNIFGITFNSALHGTFTIVVHAIDPSDNCMENEVAITLVGAQTDYIKVLVPNGGEIFNVGSDEDIKWESNVTGNTVRLEYSKDNFISDVHTIAIDEPNDGIFKWVGIPDDASTTAKIRVSVTGNPSISDTSDNFFTIYKKPDDPCQDWTVIRQGMQCSIDWETEFLVRSQQEWEDFLKIFTWANPPTIDWNKDMVCGFFLGEMMHGGFEIEVNSICLDKSYVLHVDYTKWWPGKGCSFPWVICEPYLIIKTKQYSGEVVFDGLWQEKICK